MKERKNLRLSSIYLHTSTSQELSKSFALVPDLEEIRFIKTKTTLCSNYY